MHTDNLGKAALRILKAAMEAQGYSSAQALALFYRQNELPGPPPMAVALAKAAVAAAERQQQQEQDADGSTDSESG